MSQSIELPPAVSPQSLCDRYLAVRSFTMKLCETLSPEDCCLQSMENASPVRWHLAHTSWFFETFLLKQDSSYGVFDDSYEVLFNSYYNAVGEQFPRHQRGLLSRPTLEQTFAYREHIDQAVAERIKAATDDDSHLTRIVELGIQHEQQHQELILTDLKHLFSHNPLFPVFRDGKSRSSQPHGTTTAWLPGLEGVHEIGHAGEGFAFDNESPRHRVFLEQHSIASRPVSSGEFLNFIEDGGYTRPELWLSMGWDFVQRTGCAHPLYWFQVDGSWQEYTLAGLRPLDQAAPVTHVSYFEADAYARWAGGRLPTEAEWEVHAADVPREGHFADTLLASNSAIHPASIDSEDDFPVQMFGDVWEWTSSSYAPYPGYQPAAGALGEYNGKFMCNQYVLRGGSVATSSDHIRATYRNFFSPDSQWQFSGIRLAKSE